MVNSPEFGPINPEISDDLGWIIRNDQISDNALCHTLLIEYREDIARLVFAFLKSPADIIDVVDRTIFTAILDRRKYRSDVSGKSWLYMLAVRECATTLVRTSAGHLNFAQRLIESFKLYEDPGSHDERVVHSLGKKDGLLLFLRLGKDLSEDEISYILKIPFSQVQADFKEIRERLAQHELSCPECTVQAGDEAFLEASLSTAFKMTRFNLDFSEDDLLGWKASILNRASKQHKARQARSQMTRIFQAGLFAILLVATGWFTSQNWLKQPPTPVIALAPQQTPIPSGDQSVPAQVTPVPATPFPIATNDENPDLSRILELVYNSQYLWHSLWADVQVIHNEPIAGSSSPHQVVRKQVWINPPAFSRIISGSLSGEPADSYSIMNGHLFGQNFQNGQTFKEETSDLLPDPDLQQLFFPQDLILTTGSISLGGSDVVAGHRAWILDMAYAGSRMYRFWIDAVYGVLLRRQNYAGNGYQSVMTDISVTSIFYDASFPQKIFEPYQYQGEYFAYDLSGAPEIPNPPITMAASAGHGSLELQSPPSIPLDLNISGSHLAFHSLPAAEPGNSTRSAMTLMGDNHYLGRLPLGGNAILSCQRSPDGSKIAYNSVASEVTGDTALYVADLTSIESAHPVLPGGLTAGDYAFSPDNRRLAFFGCDKASGFCGLFILDMVTGKTEQLVPLTYADYIFWKSDGRYLAFVGRDNSLDLLAQKGTTNMLLSQVYALAHEWHFTVVDVSTGMTVYNRIFNWSLLSPPPDSPTNTWDTPFKVKVGGLEGCTDRPK